MSEPPSFIQQLVITAEEIKLRKAYLQFTPRDEEILASLKPLIEGEVDLLVEEFYTLVLRFEEMREIVQRHTTLERLRAFQKEYLLSLFNGTYDEAYFESRLRVGAAHSKVGLGLKWYEGAYRLYRNLFHKLMVKQSGMDKEQLSEALSAIDKITTLDMGLTSDAYVYKYTEELSKQARELKFYRDIWRSAPGAFLTLDLDGNIIEVNPAFEALTGYCQEKSCSKNPFSLIKSEYVTPRKVEEIRDASLNPGVWEGELILRKKNGQLWNADLTLSAVKNEVGVPLGYVMIARDITELRKLVDITEAQSLEAQRSLQELKEANLETVCRLAVACEARDEVTGTHVLRIQHCVAAVARELGFPQAQAEQMGLASILHDVGKVHIPDSILMKPDKLTPEEWEIMKTHTVMGEKILGAKPYFKMAREIARWHHENFDGSGYPDGLSGYNIFIHARITKVADVFDALCDKRPYKEAWSLRRAFEMVKLMKGKELDPTVEGAFEKLYHNGEVARIREQYSTPGP